MSIKSDKKIIAKAIKDLGLDVVVTDTSLNTSYSMKWRVENEIHLKDIDSFILIRSGDIYVGVLSKRVGNGFLSMVNSLNGSSPFGGGNELPQAGMSIFPILGGGNGW